MSTSSTSSFCAWTWEPTKWIRRKQAPTFWTHLKVQIQPRRTDRASLSSRSSSVWLAHHKNNYDSVRVLSCKNIPGLLVWPSRVTIRQRKSNKTLIKLLDLNCIQVCAAGALLNVLGPELCDEDNPTPLGKKRRAAFVKTITLTLVASIIKQTVFSKESRESIASTPSRSGTPVIPKTSSPTHPYLDPLSSYLPTSRSRSASSLANSSFTSARSSPAPKFAAPADWNNMALTCPPSRRQSTNSISNVHAPAATRRFSLPTMPGVDQSHKWWNLLSQSWWNIMRSLKKGVILFLQASSLLALHVEVHQSPVPQFVAPADCNRMGLTTPRCHRQLTSKYTGGDETLLASCDAQCRWSITSMMNLQIESCNMKSADGSNHSRKHRLIFLLLVGSQVRVWSTPEPSSQVCCPCRLDHGVNHSNQP